MDRSRDWAVRCQLELREHQQSCWATLTYSEKYVPPTLSKPHLSSWLKRLRSRLPDSKVRFFASGEYGETTQRPHYHCILFGTSDEHSITSSWRFGHVRIDPITPAAISYVAGYCSKKVGWKLDRGERVDPETGELFTYQPPFILMSRNPGIAANAKKYWPSWRETAIHHGREVPVPRYLHQAWKDHASFQAQETLETERAQRELSKLDTVRESGTLFYEHERHQAMVAISLAKHARSAQNRNKL